MQEQANGAGQVGRRNFADRRAVAKQINTDPMKHSDLLMKVAQDIFAAAKMGVRKGVWALIAPKCTQIDWAGFLNLLKNMVGTRRLELLTSTVSILRYST